MGSEMCIRDSYLFCGMPGEVGQIRVKTLTPVAVMQTRMKCGKESAGRRVENDPLATIPRPTPRGRVPGGKAMKQTQPKTLWALWSDAKQVYYSAYPFGRVFAFMSRQEAREYHHTWGKSTAGYRVVKLVSPEVKP